jgi:hypothetical protein
MLIWSWKRRHGAYVVFLVTFAITAGARRVKPGMMVRPVDGTSQPARLRIMHPERAL